MGQPGTYYFEGRGPAALGVVAMKMNLADGRASDTNVRQARPRATRGHDPTVASLFSIDRSRLFACCAVLVGCGAVGRPLAEHLVYLGVRKFVLIDPKSYRPASVATQCDPEEVGLPKAIVLGEHLRRLGANVTTLVRDVYDVEPGYVEPGAVVIVSADNRRADIGANRLAAQTRVRLAKANVEPAWLLASLRWYDLRGECPETCLECQMTEAQYAQQLHPASCDGPDEPTSHAPFAVRSTASPRALTQVTAGTAALALAQIVGSPAHGEGTWFARQWQLNLLTGQATWSQLGPKADCRWDHGRHWQHMRRLPASPAALTLSSLFELSCCHHPAETQLLFSGQVATQARCPRCGQWVPGLRWLRPGVSEVGTCKCGGGLVVAPFWTCTELSAEAVQPWWNRPLAEWGVPCRAIIAVQGSGGQQRSFVVGAHSDSDDGGSP